MKQSIIIIIFIVLILSGKTVFSQNQPDTIGFSVEAYDGLDLPAQIIHPASGASDRIIVFINGSTPYDEKGNMSPMVNNKGKSILVKQDFYFRFLEIMSAKGYSIVSMAKRSEVEPTKIPRPTLDELALDITFLINELKDRQILTAEKKLYLVGYSEGSVVASKVLGWLKEQPEACIFLGSASSAFDYTRPWQEWFRNDIYRKLKNWTDDQIKTEFEEWKEIVYQLQNMDEETFEKKYKNSKPNGFGFAPWESFHIDKEMSFYFPEANILDANIPILICIGDDDTAMPEKRARTTYQNLLDKGFTKATYRVIPEEIHQYQKFDVFGIINSWILSDFATTTFQLSQQDQHLIDKYADIQKIESEFKQLPYSGSPEEVLSFYQRALSSSLLDENTWFSLGVKLVGNGFLEKAYTAFSKSNKEGSPIQSASLIWLGHLNDLKGERELALQLYKKALKVYPGFPVQHSHWNIFLNEEWINNRINSPFTSGLLVESTQ